MTIAEKMRKLLGEARRYQTHAWRGTILNTGIRGIERREYLRAGDFVGKRVLDLGCATGAECFAAVDAGAAAVLGVERDLSIAATAARLVAIARLKGKIAIVQRDLRDGLPPEAMTERWDTVLAFAILQHSGQRRFWEDVPGASVAYVESGVPSSWDAGSLSRDGWRAELIAMTPNNATDTRLLRALFRLERSG